MAPQAKQSYQIDRYTIDWLAYKRKHWAPHPSEKLLDDMVAAGDHRRVIRMLLGAITACHDFEQAQWMVRVHSEIREQKVALDAIKAHKLGKPRRGDEREKTCVVRFSSSIYLICRANLTREL